jgi:hypothetical protein
MRLNHPDYIKLVVGAYNKKKANNDLSLLLAQSTPAKIRQACLHVYKEQYDKKEQQVLRKDEQVLRDFFGPAEPGRGFLQLIREFETDRFRPLDNYLKGNTEKTDDTNLELLAWLINFQHRPYSFDKNFQLNEEELSLVKNSGGSEIMPKLGGEEMQREKEELNNLFKYESNEASDKNTEKTPALLNNIPKNNKAKEIAKRAGMISLILIICTGGIYTIWQQQDKRIIMGNTNAGCMYWANDRYEKVPGNEGSKGRLILPLNEEKMKNFKKIEREDTITEWSIGKIYYIKDSNTIKCYTEGGSYPEDVTRNLKPLSRYIFDKYLRKKEVSIKDSIAE